MWPGRKWLRKPQFSYGWDWVDALANIGIWRGVHLEGRTHAVLQHLRMDTLRQDGRVCLEMEAVLENLHPWSERACGLDLEIRASGGGVPRGRYLSGPYTVLHSCLPFRPKATIAPSRLLPSCPQKYTRPLATLAAVQPLPTFASHRSFGPPSGHFFIRPVAGKMPLRRGPRSPPEFSAPTANAAAADNSASTMTMA